MIKAKILLISDDLETGQLWANGLRQRAMDVVVAGISPEVVAHWAHESFDLVVVDIYAPQQETLTICRQLRNEIVNPILLFTYQNREPELLKAYEAGVDECIAKPVSPPLFLAKVNAWLRRSWMVPAESLQSIDSGELRLEPAARQVLTAAGRSVKLTNLEFRLLHFLMLHQGQVLENRLIVDRVWGHSGQGDNVLLKNVIYRLRRKIELDPSHPQYLQTIAGEGYIFRAHPSGEIA